MQHFFPTGRVLGQRDPLSGSRTPFGIGCSQFGSLEGGVVDFGADLVTDHGMPGVARLYQEEIDLRVLGAGLTTAEIVEAGLVDLELRAAGRREFDGGDLLGHAAAGRRNLRLRGAGD